ncbi:hypothetical protein Celal_1974 [Cellulophaga algicola DSM 14237]|uniref:Uncharacterized protein n=1 Tax=Cellulophaga algicola (strain DSM 14237 / IC166 / ACAM 630) TaxID=688270 RepID=E6X3U6_CELAD|nr:hypothetical protein [Cellulophaga algicola]ADV49271.1 hypothetical protein Celal_1974 [Cellulophaga algicola DSM 14237]
MKTIIQFLCILYIINCSGQTVQNKIMITQFTDKEIIEQGYQRKKEDTVFIKNSKLDIDRLSKKATRISLEKGLENYVEYGYEKNLSNGMYLYIRGDNLSGYQKTIRQKDAVFEDIYQYYPSGHLKMHLNYYSNRFVNGIQYWYDEQGILESYKNHDKPYKFSWVDVLLFIKEQEIKKEEIVEIHRSNGSGDYIWAIVYKPQELINTSNVKVFHLDAKTGKIIKELMFSTTRYLD